MANKGHLDFRLWNSDSDGTLSEAALVNMLESKGYVCTRYTYPAGTCFPEHSHNIDKIDAVIKGKFKISMYGESIVLSAGDYVHIPANTLHSAEVVGDQSVVSIDAVKKS